jgi:uncharacterized protein YkwD
MPQSRTRKTGHTDARQAGSSNREGARPRASDEEIEAAIFDLVNQERTRRGIPAVSRHPRLDTVARNYAQLMAARNEMGHFVGGTTPGQRITAGGYRWSRYGENVARGYRTAQAVMNGWMNSPGHRANILNSQFVNVGIGVATRNNRTKFFCQDFASPRRGRTATRGVTLATSSIAVEEEYGESVDSSSITESISSLT